MCCRISFLSSSVSYSIVRLQMIGQEENKKLILQDKLKALKNLLRFWENTYNDLCKSVAETDDLLCTAVGAA